MKKLLLIPVLAMTLSACSPQAQQKLVTIVADVQAAAVLTCKFEPTATTILSIVTANQSATVAQIADLICGAVKAQDSRPHPAVQRLYS